MTVHEVPSENPTVNEPTWFIDEGNPVPVTVTSWPPAGLRGVGAIEVIVGVTTYSETKSVSTGTIPSVVMITGSHEPAVHGC